MNTSQPFNRLNLRPCPDQSTIYFNLLSIFVPFVHHSSHHHEHPAH